MFACVCVCVYEYSAHVFFGSRHRRHTITRWLTSCKSHRNAEHKVIVVVVDELNDDATTANTRKHWPAAVGTVIYRSIQCLFFFRAVTFPRKKNSNSRQLQCATQSVILVSLEKCSRLPVVRVLAVSSLNFQEFHSYSTSTSFSSQVFFCVVTILSFSCLFLWCS